MAGILVVEDDSTIGAAVVAVLRGARHDVRLCRDGATALAELAAHPGDLVLVDLGLPDMDGVDLCRTMRTRWPELVLVILTARDSEIDVVVGLEAGADDYLTKPVRGTELAARVRAHLRRRLPVTGSVRRLGPLCIDESSRVVSLHDRPISLTAKEFQLLARLAADAGCAVSRSTLMSDVWDVHWHGSTKTLDVHIAALRRHFDETSCPRIVTLRGFGYRLEV